MGETRERLPAWLRVKVGKGVLGSRTREVLMRHGVSTVCSNARCPNIGECYESGTATFLLLGERCTRACGFCAVAAGAPLPPDPTEPRRVAGAAAELGLTHVVLTSVTRDDLDDGGAGCFVAAVHHIRGALPQATVEVLVPDFLGSAPAIDAVARCGADVVNHNIETVPRLYAVVRPEADYERSLALLARVRAVVPGARTKSGIMLGLGETTEEVLGVMDDLREAGCGVLTLGQYLRPSAAHLPVARYVPPEEFAALGQAAREKGFGFVASAPFARSSYRAHEALTQGTPAGRP